MSLKGPVLIRLPKGKDLLEALAEAAASINATKAHVAVIGALEKTKLGYYLQDERRYVDFSFDEHVEILCGQGNISLKDGKPFVHLHLTLSRKDCSCLGGHAMAGSIIFAAEACITPVAGDALVRGFDEPTGLFLWK
ncbi:MAG: DUF296 domain-containing protein [Desulfovibrionaceae bacterium]|nr:DUF296 domain-containing protein [Desulfovibrionaceae bacterium]